MVEPTDKSTCFIAMTRVWPTVRNATTLTPKKISRAPLREMIAGLANAVTPKTITSAIPTGISRIANNLVRNLLIVSPLQLQQR